MLFGGLSAIVHSASTPTAEGVHLCEELNVRLAETGELRSARVPCFRRANRRACEPSNPLLSESAETPSRAAVDQLIAGTSPVLNLLSRFSSVPTWWTSEGAAAAPSSSSSIPSVEQLPTFYAGVGVFVGSRSLVLSDSSGDIILSSPFQQIVAVKFHSPKVGSPVIASDGFVRAEAQVRRGSSGVAAPPCLEVATPLAELQVFTCSRQLPAQEEDSLVGSKQFDCVTALHANTREGVQKLQAVKQRLLEAWSRYLESRSSASDTRHTAASLAPETTNTFDAIGRSMRTRGSTLAETRLIRPSVEQVLASARGTTATRASHPVHELTSALSKRTKQFLWNPAAAALSPVLETTRGAAEVPARSPQSAPCLGTANAVTPTSLLQDIRITVLSGGSVGDETAGTNRKEATATHNNTSDPACEKDALAHMEAARQAIFAARALLPPSSLYSHPRPSSAAGRTPNTTTNVRELPPQAASSPVRWSLGRDPSEALVPAERHRSALLGVRQGSGVTSADAPTERGNRSEATTTATSPNGCEPQARTAASVSVERKAVRTEPAKPAATPGAAPSYPLTCVTCGSVFDLRYRAQHLADCIGRKPTALL